MDPGWLAPIDAYCERTGAGFWAEPLNAVSNGGFLIAAGAAAWHERSGPVRNPAALGLAVLAGAVGIGSFLFHTVANRWSMLADVIPIALFIYAYFGLALHRFFGLPTGAAVTATLAFAGLNVGFAPGLDALTGRSTSALSNGSIDYVPAVSALFCVGSALRFGRSGAAHRRTGRAILGIGALFLVSLTFRTIDAAACSSLPAGTHALWHLLNAAVLYALIVAATDFPDDDGRSPRSA